MNTTQIPKATKPTRADAINASKMVTNYRQTGGGSNRTNWERLVAITTAVLCVLRTGKAVEITDLFTEGDAPVYHQAHRSLGVDMLRPVWAKVTPVSYRTDGTTTTTGKVGQVRTFLEPAVKA